MRKYLVCYFHWTDRVSSGFGDTIIEEGEDEDIYTEDELEVIRKYIVEKNKFSGCSIQNIILLN
jgi:hypothetical protein